MNKDCELAYMCQKGDLNNVCGMPETHIRKECFRCDGQKLAKHGKIVNENETKENIEQNKDTDTLTMQPIDEFTKEFIKKTKGMNKKQIAFTVWEFGNWQWGRGVEYEQEKQTRCRQNDA